MRTVTQADVDRSMTRACNARPFRFAARDGGEHRIVSLEKVLGNDGAGKRHRRQVEPECLSDICLVGESVQFCSDDDQLRLLEWR
jgi:hypothetical protein